ncbi:unnamed protein product [Adineta steineri]|uniref:Uncharacterized protein n=2 Tax=Adineta steineri TaxID=433720 RepID=A0A819M753_9BILA|nr:unnamed protein product [Adineta steineri]
MCTYSTKNLSQPWPILKHYDQEHLYNIALPLGGIGTGTVSLGGRGELRDWEIGNKPAKKYSTVTTGNDAPFFSIFVNQPSTSTKITKALIGPVHPTEYLHYEGRACNNHGLPRFEHASFDAAYPFGMVNLSDSKMPVQVCIKGFNPFIPTDAESSGIPIAILYYEVTNTTNETLDVSICGSMRNFVGQDGSKYFIAGNGDYVPTGAKNNTNIYREDLAGKLKGIYMNSTKVDPNDPAWGTIALTTLVDSSNTTNVTYRLSSISNAWYHAILDFWDDFSADGTLHDKGQLIDDNPMGSLAVKKQIQPHSTELFPFFITWNFPNRMAWSSTIVGNYYSTLYKDAWDVCIKTLPSLADLESTTLDFINLILASDYPGVLKEAALFNLATLRSQTVFRINDGHLMAWEGIFDIFGSCYGSCTHVWNYEQAIGFLFGNLAKTMRDVEFNYATFDDGAMNFRVQLPLTKPQTRTGTAADGQMGCIMKMYRDWQLSGDDEFLRKNWEQVKKVLGFAWQPNSWDTDQDGVEEGAQPNTMDVTYYGPNPQCNFWYLGALRAAFVMALYLGDETFSNKCLSLFTNGSKWVDTNLFNGEYYEQKIIDPKTGQFLDHNDPNVPDYQLGKGCLVDQLVGQMMAHVCNLGYLAIPENIATTCRSILKYNYLDTFNEHFNNMRSYVLGNESGLLMASWPRGRLQFPFPYFSESMTGFEYTAACNMIYENQTQQGLKCVQSIRDRFDGLKRNPFSEPECGHHYGRSMTSWTTLLAWSGFHYSAVTRTMEFGIRTGVFFWSNGYSWGSCWIVENRTQAHLMVSYGSIEIEYFGLQGKTMKKLPERVILSAKSDMKTLTIDFDN